MDADGEYFWVSVGPGANGEVMVEARGELDAASAPRLRTAVSEAVAGGAVLGLDLGEVGFIDSSGLRVVAEAVRLARAAGSEVRLAAASDSVRRVFELTGVDALFMA
jgi:anti-anti-sigma factor